MIIFWNLISFYLVLYVFMSFWYLLNLFMLLLLLSHVSCVRLCDPIDSSPTGSSVPGILKTRILEWLAISFSSAWKWKVKVKSLSHVQLLATPWTVAYQAPPSMGFSRQEYWSGVPLPTPLFMLACIKVYWILKQYIFFFHPRSSIFLRESILLTVS